MLRLLIPAPLVLALPVAAQCELDVHTAVTFNSSLGQDVAIDGHRILAGGSYWFDPDVESLRFDGDRTYLVQEFETGLFADYFGRELELEGDLLVIGAGGDDTLGTDTGRVYTYRLTAAGFVEEAVIPTPDPTVQWFGETLALDGDVLVAGVGNANGFTGAVWVYRFDGLVWNLEQQLVSPAPAPFTAYGDAVAVEGDRILVGAPWTGDYEGAAYAWEYDGAAWNLVQEFAPVDLSSDDRFGTSVDLEGDTAVVGAAAFDLGLTTQAGAVYAYTWGGGGWSQTEKLAPAGVAEEARFGFDVELAGDVLAVGAPYLGPDDDGRVYLYRRVAGVWTLDAELDPQQGGAPDRFGTSLEIDGDLLVIGAPGGGNQNHGQLHVYGIDCSPSIEFYGCGGAELAASVVVLDGDTTLGGTLTLGLENPLGTQTAGSTLAFVAVATAPAPGFPCGLALPGFGPAGGGSAGEVLLSLTPPDPFQVVPGTPWQGLGHPAAVGLALPAVPALDGAVLYLQGFLVDPVGAVAPVVATGGVRIVLNS